MDLAVAGDRSAMSDCAVSGTLNSNPTYRVKASCECVCSHARRVSVARVDRLSRQLRYLLENAVLRKSEAWRYQKEYHLDVTGQRNARERLAAYLLALAAVNYGSGYAQWLRRDPPNSTYYTISSCLAEAFDHYPLHRADALRSLSVANVAEIFGQDLRVPKVAELMQRFRDSLAQIGEFVETRHGGSALQFLDDIEFNALSIVQALTTHVPTFNDRCRYSISEREIDVFFYKKAQLFAADIARAGRAYGFWDISGIDYLTLFADNAVAQVLLALGVLLVHDKELAHRIDSGTPLDVCGADEVELRACAVNAAHMILQNLRRTPEGNDLTIIELDFFLWDVSHSPEFIEHSEIKRHISFTEFY